MAKIQAYSRQNNLVTLPLKKAGIAPFEESPFISAAAEARVVAALDRLRVAIRSREHARHIHDEEVRALRALIEEKEKQKEKEKKGKPVVQAKPANDSEGS